MATKKETKPVKPVDIDEKKEDIIETEDDLDFLDKSDDDEEDESWGSVNEAYSDIMKSMKEYFDQKNMELDALITNMPNDVMRIDPLIDMCSELENFSYDTVRLLFGVTQAFFDISPVESYVTEIIGSEWTDNDMCRLASRSKKKCDKKKLKKKGKKRSSKSKKVKTKTIKVGKNKIKIIKF